MMSGSTSLPRWTTWRSQTFSESVRDPPGGCGSPGRGRVDGWLGVPAASGSYVDDLDLEGTPGRCVLHRCHRPSARGGPGRAASRGRPRSDPPAVPRWSPRRSRWSRPRHRPRTGGSRPCPVPPCRREAWRGIDHGGRLEQALEQTDTRLHLALGVLGRRGSRRSPTDRRAPGRTRWRRLSPPVPGWSGPRARPAAGRRCLGSVGRRWCHSRPTRLMGGHPGSARADGCDHPAVPVE